MLLAWHRGRALVVAHLHESEARVRRCLRLDERSGHILRGVVHDHDLEGRMRLRREGREQNGQSLRFVPRRHDDGHRQRGGG